VEESPAGRRPSGRFKDRRKAGPDSGAGLLLCPLGSADSESGTPFWSRDFIRADFEWGVAGEAGQSRDFIRSDFEWATVSRRLRAAGEPTPESGKGGPGRPLTQVRFLT